MANPTEVKRISFETNKGRIDFQVYRGKPDGVREIVTYRYDGPSNSGTIQVPNPDEFPMIAYQQKILKKLGAEVISMS